MKIIEKLISELKSAHYNPRKLSAKQYEDLKASIGKFGAMEPAIINMHKSSINTVVSGHQRLKVASSLGLLKWPCIEVNLDLAREKELNIRMNKNSGEFDFMSGCPLFCGLFIV